MYDLLQNWPELENLKKNDWEIDSFYDHDRQAHTFTFNLYDGDLGDEIYTIEVIFRQGHLNWYCAVNIDTFFAHNSYDLMVGMQCLEIIKNKALDIKAIMDNKDVPEQLGRC